ncbi:hypothetical protein D3C77_346940 [compost metagenome]
MLDIGGIVLPDIGGRLRYCNRLPLSVAGEDFGVFLVEHRRIDTGDRRGDFLLAWPDVTQVHRLAILAGAQGFAAQVQAHAPGQGIGHHQRWRGQPVGFHQRVHAAFEVAVARQYRGDGEVGAGDGFLDGFVQWPGVADAGGAAIADQVEAQLIQIGRQASRLVVVGHYLGAGGQ